ncbi:MAG: fumarylacetoacetate hydrolase family protein [Solirubrobacterales bacterium]|nr:fumarylacetoacetate hydrolase family protein [Solirubrobacterales bacterium]
MRLVTYEHGGARCGGLLLGERIVALAELGAPAHSVRGVLEALDRDELLALGERAAASSAGIERVRATLLAPVPDPEKIICLGLNYRDHAAETGQEAPTAPMWFAKFANSLIGSGGEIVLPRAHPDCVDYEAELAIVIGRTARNVEAPAALHHVAGAMPFNDVSARDLQMQNPLWTSGKALTRTPPRMRLAAHRGALGAHGCAPARRKFLWLGR